MRELGSFFLCRLATGGLDLAVMYVCVDRLGLPDIPVKAASNVLVVVLNYAPRWLYILVSCLINDKMHDLRLRVRQTAGLFI